MKKSGFISFCVMLLFLLVTPAAQSGNPVNTPATHITPQNNIEAQRLISRLKEIKAMDKSTLSADEKKALRKEVKATKKQLREIGGGVYISAGALVLILILLIILT